MVVADIWGRNQAVFEPININKFLNREHIGDYAEMRIDTYVSSHGKEGRGYQNAHCTITKPWGEGEPLIWCME